MKVICLNCKIVLYSKKTIRFCSKSCSTSYNNKLRKRKIKFCMQCSNPISLRNKYCDNICQQEYFYHNLTKPRIEEGLISDRVPLKRYLTKERGYKCSSCGLRKWMGEPLPLELDHKDGNAGNNLPDNIRLLCSNCHSITPTWKGRNKGSGRKSRNLPVN